MFCVPTSEPRSNHKSVKLSTTIMCRTHIHAHPHLKKKQLQCGVAPIDLSPWVGITLSNATSTVNNTKTHSSGSHSQTKGVGPTCGRLKQTSLLSPQADQLVVVSGRPIVFDAGGIGDTSL